MSNAHRLITILSRVREAGLLVALAAIVIGVTIREPRFTSVNNIRAILLSIAIIAIVAIGQTVVVLTRNIDLSVASIVGLVAYSVRDLLLHHPGTSIALAIAIGLLIGGGLGALNGATGYGWACAGDRGDVGHALCLSRADLRAGRRQIDHRDQRTTRFPEDRAFAAVGHSDANHHRGRAWTDLCLGAAIRPDWAAAVCGGQQSRGGAAGRYPVRAGLCLAPTSSVDC